MENQLIGIDIGGTFVKFGLIGKDGAVLEFHKIATEEMKAGGEFVKNFIQYLEKELARFPHVKSIGIGIPGTLNKERSMVLEVPAIPDLNGLALGDYLSKSFPEKVFSLENDANAAALGELHFSNNNLPDNFLFITLGTGVGGAAIINRQVFKGGDGNSMEIGHVVSQHDQSLEMNIGKKGMLKLAAEMTNAYQKESLIKSKGVLGSQMLIKAADEGDELAIAVFHKVAVLLAEALVSTVRILDVKTILIGGGLSACFNHIIDPLIDVLHHKLTPYYTKELVIKKALLGNDAGLIGAAALGIGISKINSKIMS